MGLPVLMTSNMMDVCYAIDAKRRPFKNQEQGDVNLKKRQHCLLLHNKTATLLKELIPGNIT